MENRFKTIFKDLSEAGVSFSTIHSFAYSLLREYAYLNKIKFRIIEGEKSEINKTQLLKRIYYKINENYISEDKLEELISSISYVKNMLIDERDFNKYNFNIPGFKDIYREYEMIKRENNLLDYDDMLTLTYEILRKSQGLLNKYRNKYKYIQVDEAQDTSKVQHEIVRLLAYPENNLFLVGDEDQSIYSFRGAYPEAILNFEREYKGSKIFLMEQNFRSTKNITMTSNEFIRGNKERYNKNMYTEKEEEIPVTIKFLMNEEEEVKYIIDEIYENKKLKDTAILYRNNLSAIPLVDALSKNGIPFYLRDFKQSFFTHWVVQDITAFINVALNREDIHSFERIYYKMNSYISKKAMEHIKRHYKGQSVFDLLRRCPDLNPYIIKRINSIEECFRILPYKKPKDAIDFLQNQLSYKEYLDNNCEKMGYSIENINLIIASLKIIANNTTSITGFLNRFEELQKLMDDAKFNKDKDAVTLSTIHSAKGLEFENVFMIDLIEGQFPAAGSISDEDENYEKYIEEERRLFYVGMTRAKKQLNLLAVNTKNQERVVCSRFVGEVFSIVNPVDKEEELSSLNSYGFSIGTSVIHKRFGQGIIIDINQETVEINFNIYGIKKLLMRACIEENLLYKI
nr:ATP-dependent helicase [Fervidicella metallireducens]